MNVDADRSTRPRRPAGRHRGRGTLRRRVRRSTPGRSASTGRIGVVARTTPTTMPPGTTPDWLRTVAAGHAFCSVFNRAGSCLGSSTLTWAMLACGPLGVGDLRVEARPIARAKCAPRPVRLNFGAKPSAAQLAAWKAWRAGRSPRTCPSTVAVIDIGEQLVGLKNEVFAVDVDVDRPDLQRDTVEDLRKRVGGDRHAVVCGSMSIAARTIDHTQVERARDRGHDDREAERRAVVRPGEEHFAGHVERVRPRAHAVVTCPIRLSCPHCPLACGSSHSVTDETIAEQPGRGLHLDAVHRLFWFQPSARDSLTVNGLNPPAWLSSVPVTSDGAELPAAAPFVDLEGPARGGRRARFRRRIGCERARDGVGAAGRRSRRAPPAGPPKKCELQVAERDLWRQEVRPSPRGSLLPSPGLPRTAWSAGRWPGRGLPRRES